MLGYIAYLVYFILAFVSSTAGTVLIPGMIRLGGLGFSLLILGFIELYHLLIKKDYREEDWIFGIIVVFLMLLGLKNGAGTQAGNFFVIFSMRRLRFRKLALIGMITGAVMLLITMYGAANGFIAYYPFYEWDGSIITFRRALGFTYTLFPSAVFANLLALYIYIRRTKITYIELIVLAFMNSWFFFACMGELSYLSGIAFVLAGLIWKTRAVIRESIIRKDSDEVQTEKARRSSLRNKLLCAMAGLVYPTCTLASFFIVRLYRPGSGLLERINQWSRGRIALPKEAIAKYGLHLFGKNIEWVGNGIDPFSQTTGVYNYVDNLYLHVALQYGVIALVLMVLAASLTMVYLVRKKEWYLLFVMLILAGHGMLDDLSLYFHFNGFLLLAGKAFDLLAEWKGKPYHWEEMEREDRILKALFPRDSIRHHFLMNALLSASNFLFPLITFPYVSRILLPEGTGRVRFASSVIAVFVMIAQLGIPTYGIRACARVRDNREKLSETVRSLLSINIVTSIIAYVLLIAGLYTIPQLKAEQQLIVLTSTMILFNTMGMEWMFRGLEQYTYITVRSILFKALALILTFVLIRDQDDVMIYAALSILASSASQIMNFFYAWNFVDLFPASVGGKDHSVRTSVSLKTRWRRIHMHLVPALIFFAMAFATTLYTNLDVLMLQFMTSTVEVGYYDAVVRIRTILITIVASLGTVLMPRASYLIEEKRYEDFKGIFSRAMHYVVLTAIPLMLFFVFFGEKILILFSGEAYLPGVDALRILIPTILLIGVTNILGIQLLVPAGKEKQVLYSELAGAGVDFVLNLILIPRFSVSGAAFGTLIAELVVLIIQCLAIRKLELPVNVWSTIKVIPAIQIISASLVSVMISFFVGQIPAVSQASTIINVSVSAIVFATMYLILALLLKDQLVIEGLQMLRNNGNK